jgi:hypothetical protein
MILFVLKPLIVTFFTRILLFSSTKIAESKSSDIFVPGIPTFESLIFEMSSETAFTKYLEFPLCDF